MKTKLLILSICFGLLSLGATARVKDGKALTGNSLTEFGNYTIVQSDVSMVVNDQALKTYNLMYENITNPIQIGVIPEKDCTSFILRSDEFEVEYVCNKNVFGVKKIEKDYQVFSKDENEEKLNAVSYYAQRVICQNPKTLDELLGLIACYFPNLVNEEYHASF